ncbi:unnamed protein product [Peronospora destructor]|uniref:Uncharacterized protein n=1 Tax=Peronospora destructor TaxID=86335 RepID=A0AAV0T3D8_9STRA|nr:unnamed protein product [Peronospora destructor]
MTYDLKATNSSGEEDEELMFPFEQEDDDFFSPRLHSQGSGIFNPIDGVDIERPANPLVAILEYQEAIDGQNKESIQELREEKQVAVTPVPRSRKRKTLQLPNAPTQIICPVAKRLKSSVYERGITAPASLMGSLSLDRTRDRYHQQIESLSASGEQDGQGQRDALVSHITERDDSHLCSSSSSSKSWTSGLELVCQRSLDVSSPVCEYFNDLALHS